MWDSWREVPDGSCFGDAVNSKEEEPEIYLDRVLSHTFSFTDREMHMRGNKELPGGWEITGPLKKQKSCQEDEEILWAPGSCVSKEVKWGINTHGIWYPTDKGAPSHD